MKQYVRPTKYDDVEFRGKGSSQGVIELNEGSVEVW